MSDSKHCHPLLHQGASRLGRLVQTLRPDAFQLDERTIQELIVEAHRFARTLRFFDETNTQTAGAYWENFWEVEILTYLAVVAATDTDEIRRQYQELNEQFEQAKEAKPAPGGKKKQGTVTASYLPLLEHLRLLAFSLEDAYLKLVRIKHPLQTLLLNRIRRDNCCDQEELEGALVKLIGYHKGADAGLQMSKYAGFFAPDKRWGLEDRIEYDAIAANPHFNQNDLNELFNTFFNTWLVLKNAAQAGFDAELTRMELPEEVEYRIVQPHIVLFLVFLRLFRYAQESLNELGTKHLDFYYEEILGLRRRGEVPDEVYLLFELAKDFDQHLLEKGTLFDAGKDKNGQPLLFETIEDWVLRPAQVADLKNTWIDLQCGGIHANPDVKKAYRDGAEKPNESAKYWRTMGDDRHLPDGELGFAISSPQLILREGKRIIDIWLNIAFPEQADCSWLSEAEYLKVYLSAKESWIELEYNPQDIDSDTALPDLSKGSFNVFFYAAIPPAPPNNPGALATIHIRIILERDDPAVDGLGEALAVQAGFDTQWPVLKVLINQELEKPCPTDTEQHLTSAEVYDNLRQLVIGEAVIKVEARGIREHLIIQTDQGVFDGTEKVFPFGPQPEIGHFFYVGSTEVFQKALSELKVNILWIGPPDNFLKHYEAYTDDNNQLIPMDPKVQIDFIDKADVTTPEPKEKIEFGLTGIDTQKALMKVFGDVFDLANLSNVLTVENNNVTYVFNPISGKYDVEIAAAPFASEIKLIESLRTYKFNLGKTNQFKAYLLPASPNAVVIRQHKSTALKIEVKDILNQTIDDPEIKVGTATIINPDDDGNYFVLVTALQGRDLSIKAATFQNAVLNNEDYDSSEFSQFSKIDVKLYTNVAAAIPSPSSTSNDTIISVKVIDRAGQPISGAAVSAFKGSTLKQQNTDSNGLTDFTGLPPGDTGWTLQAFHAGARSLRVNNAETKKLYTIQVSDEITLSDPFKGILRGVVKSLDNDNPVWGAKFFDSANLGTALGETKENGSFEISGVSLNIDKATLIHEAFESIELDITDNAEFEITLVPKATYHTFTGKVISFFDATKGIQNVEVSVKGTGIKTKTNIQGEFSIHVPTDLTLPAILTFSKSGFKTVDLNTAGLANPVSFIEITLPEANPVELLLIEQSGKKIIRDSFEVAINPLNVKRDPRTQEFSQYSPTLKRGFLRFKLVNGDFLHDEYPKVLTKQTIALSKPGTQTPAPIIPNPPYSPSTNFISVDYISTQVITGSQNDGIDQYYHLLSFNGHKWIPLEAVKPETEPKVQMIYPYMPDDTLPVTKNGTIRPYTPGNLFIGISELTPGGALSLLFQIADGTEPQPEALAPAIHWSYLAAGNTWLPFKTGEIIRDNTNGLTRSGIIQFAIPTLAVKENTMLNPEYFWLRAAAKQADPALNESLTTVQALPSMTNIRAQVVQARFKNQNNDFAHLAQPLPAETISKLLESRTAVKKVEQPLESFGGRLPESAGLDFYYRVSERLRHKDRAVTVWDYEHLLLEHYPLAAAAKCIQHTRYKPTKPTFKASELAPGYVTVAVIPDLKKRKGEPWPEPRFTQGDLDDMRGFLAARANLFVAYGEGTEAHLQVVNPLYEKVDVLVTVAFKPGVDEAFYKQQLQQELTHYISPWLANPAQPPAFGRTLERSAILQFIEARPYVDYVVVEAGKFLIRMQVIDIAGRPVVFQQTWPPNAPPTETVTTIKSRYVDGKICPGTARSILVAGSIIVGSIKDDLPVKLPPMPAKAQPVATTPTTPGNGSKPGLSASTVSTASKPAPANLTRTETVKNVSAANTANVAEKPKTTRKTNK